MLADDSGASSDRWRALSQVGRGVRVMISERGGHGRWSTRIVSGMRPCRTCRWRSVVVVVGVIVCRCGLLSWAVLLWQWWWVRLC